MDDLRAAAAVQPQAADHARRRRAASTTRPAPPRTTTGDAHGRGSRSGAGFVDDVDRPRQHRPQLQRRGPGGVAGDGQGAPDRAYGTLRYTIGTGCSGGSLAQQWIANAYPGIYQGILPTCSFPDAWGTATQFLDYHLTARATSRTRRSGGPAWPGRPTQMADVEGGSRRRRERAGQPTPRSSTSSIPTDPCAGSPTTQRYNPMTNPGGVRCTIQDAAINVFGPRPEAIWSPSEQQLGHGFARHAGRQRRRPVRAGRAAGRARSRPAQFVDLNARSRRPGHRRQPDARPDRQRGRTGARPTPTAAA